jgi:hypothetical protein
MESFRGLSKRQTAEDIFNELEDDLAGILDDLEDL